MPRLSYVWGHAQSQLIYASLALSAIAVSLSHSVADYNADCLGLQNFFLPPTQLFFIIICCVFVAVACSQWLLKWQCIYFVFYVSQ